MNSKTTAEQYLKQGSGFITLCGSTKFFEQYIEAYRRLTFMNWIVLSVGSYGHSYHKDKPTELQQNFEMVKKLHFLKILESAAIVVISDETGYIGSSTKKEIEFAKYRNIPVFYFDGREFFGETNHTPYDDLKDTSIVDAFADTHGGLGFC